MLRDHPEYSLDDHIHGKNINPSGQDVGRDEDLVFAVPKRRHVLISLSRFQIGTDFDALMPGGGQLSDEVRSRGFFLQFKPRLGCLSFNLTGTYPCEDHALANGKNGIELL